jgi:hypothetical protein
MGIADKLPGLKPGATGQNIIVGALYVLGGVFVMFLGLAFLAILLLGGGGGAADQPTAADGGASEATVDQAPDPTPTVDQTPDPTPTAQPTAESAPTHTQGESFVVGSGEQRVRYRVTGATTADQVGGSDFGAEASGEFVILSLQIENVGQESFDLSSRVFRLIDSQGREYETDNEAGVYLEDSIEYEQLNPGLTVEGRIVFDVPTEQQGRMLQIEPAGVFSGAEPHLVRLEVS